MRISAFTTPELDRYRALCNFTPAESALFELRAGGVSLEECSDTLGYSISTIGRLSQKVNAKIHRV